MSALPFPRITPEQYLELDRKAEIRSEYYEGEMYAMAGGTKNHARICLNCGWLLRAAALRGGCDAYIMNVRARIAGKGPYFYPDVVVECGEAIAEEPDDMTSRPVVVLEVLSDSTEDFDRGRKGTSYRRVPSLREYILVAQSEPSVTVYRRTPKNTWEEEEITGVSASLRLESLDAEIPLSAIYADVRFDNE